MEPSVGVKREKFPEFLTTLLKINPLLRGEISKPGSVPAGCDDGMAEIAKCDHVLGSVWTARARSDVMSVEYAIRIALPVAADLTLLVITALDEAG